MNEFELKESCINIVDETSETKRTTDPGKIQPKTTDGIKHILNVKTQRNGLL